jgi:hypothetical protein
MSSFDPLQRQSRKAASTTAPETSARQSVHPLRTIASTPTPLASKQSGSQRARPHQQFDLRRIPIFPNQRNSAGLPDALKARMETLSGLSLDDVKVHYHSPRPAHMRALAYTQGTDIHLGPGQEKHLPHELWHVVQQKQRRVKPTMQIRGTAINDHAGLEAEAEAMGRNAVQKLAGINDVGAQHISRIQTTPSGGTGDSVVQRVRVTIPEYGEEIDTENEADMKKLIADLEEFKDEELNGSVEAVLKEKDPKALAYLEVHSTYWKERSGGKTVMKTRGPTRAVVEALNKAVEPHSATMPEGYVGIWRFHGRPEEYQSHRYRQARQSGQTVPDEELDKLRNNPSQQALHMYKSSKKAKSVGISYTRSLDDILDQSYHVGADSALAFTIRGEEKTKKKGAKEELPFFSTIPALSTDPLKKEKATFSEPSTDEELPFFSTIPALSTDPLKKEKATFSELSTDEELPFFSTMPALSTDPLRKQKATSFAPVAKEAQERKVPQKEKTSLLPSPTGISTEETSKETAPRKGKEPMPSPTVPVNLSEEKRPPAAWLAYTQVPKSTLSLPEDVEVPKPEKKDKAKELNLTVGSGESIKLKPKDIDRMKEARERSKAETEALYIPPRGSGGQAPRPLAVFRNPFLALQTEHKHVKNPETVKLEQLTPEELEDLYKT